MARCSQYSQWRNGSIQTVSSDNVLNEEDIDMGSNFISTRDKFIVHTNISQHVIKSLAVLCTGTQQEMSKQY